MYVLGKVLLHLLHAFVNIVGNVDVVCTRLGNNDHADHGHTIHLHVALQVARTNFCNPHIREAHKATCVFLNYEVVKFLRSVELSECTNFKLHLVAFNRTRGEFHILTVKGTLNIHRRDGVTCHLHGV